MARFGCYFTRLVMSLAHAILAVLATDKCTGYELANHLDRAVSYYWPSSHQQIYLELSRLAERGWVTFRTKPGKTQREKKIYWTTRSGITELVRWCSEPSEPIKPKEALLIRVFSGPLVGPDIVIQTLADHHSAHKARLDEYLAIEQKYFPDPNNIPTAEEYRYITLRRGILHEKAWLDWYREALRRIEGMRKAGK
jgi:DNA-binding PadR family transcriptional regulator